MANSTSSPTDATDVPRAHEGAHYANPSSKPLEAPLGPTEREGTQRMVWKLFFVVMLCVVAMVAVLGLVARHP
jgi:hypothetical protein